MPATTAKAAGAHEDLVLRGVTVCTDALDRDGEVVLPEGLETARYLQNPVMLFGHQMNQPAVAKAQALYLAGGAMKADIAFAPTTFGRELHTLYSGGYMKGFSVGFIPKVAGPPTREQVARRPELARCKRVISRGELIEISLILVPSNPEALAQAEAKGVRLSSATRQALLPSVKRLEYLPELRFRTERQVVQAIAQKAVSGASAALATAVLTHLAIARRGPRAA